MKTQHRFLTDTSHLAVALFLFAGSVNVAESVKKTESPQTPSASPAAPSPSPLGVFGADMPAAGKLVVSIIPQFANLSTIMKGTRFVSPEEVVATTPWYIDPTKKVRGVPQNTFVATQTVALAYGLTKDLAVVVIVGMVEKNLDFLTFKGTTGLTRLGMSYTGTDSLSDSSASAIYRIYEDPIHRIQLNLGMSLPTGSARNTFTLTAARWDLRNDPRLLRKAAWIGDL